MLLRNCFGFWIEISLVIGGADDRAVSEEGEIPTGVFVYLDGIEGSISVECFPRNLKHQFVASLVWSQVDPELYCVDLAVSFNERHSRLSRDWWLSLGFDASPLIDALE